MPTNFLTIVAKKLTGDLMESDLDLTGQTLLMGIEHKFTNNIVYHKKTYLIVYQITQMSLNRYRLVQCLVVQTDTPIFICVEQIKKIEVSICNIKITTLY